MWAAILTLIGVLATAAVSYSVNQNTNAQNQANVDKTNETNLQIARENNETQLDLTKNQLTYAVQDAERNGFSKLTALGNSGNYSSANIVSPVMESYHNQPFDLNGVMSSLLGVGDIYNKSRGLDIENKSVDNAYELGKRANELANRSEDAREREFLNQISENAQNLEKQLDNAKDIAEMNRISAEYIAKAQISANILMSRESNSVKESMQQQQLNHDSIIKSEEYKHALELMEKSNAFTSSENAKNRKNETKQNVIKGVFGVVNSLIGAGSRLLSLKNMLGGN